MKILFNKTPGESTGGANELQRITGNYFANNNFDKIQTDILLESEALRKLIGPAVYQIAEDFYYGVPGQELPTTTREDVLQHLQLAIAFCATNKFYKSTIISHEDSGRKLKVDKQSESVPWEWMYDRDDQANERKAFATIDRLINYLDETRLTEWKNSEAQKATRNLFVNSAKIFHDAYPIDHSGRFYYAVVPFIKTIERDDIGLALGEEKYKELLEWHKNIENDDQPEQGATAEDLENSVLLALIRQAVPLLTMAVAVSRFSLNVLPYEVVQQFKSMMQTASGSQAALPEIIRTFSLELEKKAQKSLDQMKKYLQRNVPNSKVYQLIPKNPPEQKFFRT